MKLSGTSRIPRSSFTGARLHLQDFIECLAKSGLAWQPDARARCDFEVGREHECSEPARILLSAAKCRPRILTRRRYLPAHLYYAAGPPQLGALVDFWVLHHLDNPPHVCVGSAARKQQWSPTNTWDGWRWRSRPVSARAWLENCSVNLAAPKPFSAPRSRRSKPSGSLQPSPRNFTSGVRSASRQRNWRRSRPSASGCLHGTSHTIRHVSARSMIRRRYSMSAETLNFSAAI